MKKPLRSSENLRLHVLLVTCAGGAPKKVGEVHWYRSPTGSVWRAVVKVLPPGGDKWLHGDGWTNEPHEYGAPSGALYQALQGMRRYHSSLKDKPDRIPGGIAVRGESMDFMLNKLAQWLDAEVFSSGP